MNSKNGKETMAGARLLRHGRRGHPRAWPFLLKMLGVVGAMGKLVCAKEDARRGISYLLFHFACDALRSTNGNETLLQASTRILPQSLSSLC